VSAATDAAQQLVRRLLASGVSDAVLSPGSRSGPIARALVAAEVAGLLRLHVRVDEREAAYLALGMAKASGRLTPVVTTSGTAVANLHPAMLEAVHAGVPLLAVTADRPGRLRGTGANQTTDQPGIFRHVRSLQAIDEVGRSDSPASGRYPHPAHLNVELDDPLTEVVEWDFTHSPVDPPEVPLRGSVALRPGKPTVVVAGDDAGPRARAVAEAGGWPLLAEPTSGARTGDALTAYRLLLPHSPLTDRVERVVSFGHATLSRAVVSLLSRDIEIVHVGTQSTFPVPAGPNVSVVDDVTVDGADDAAWLEDWHQADKAVAAAVSGLDDDRLAAARAVWSAVPPGALLWVGSSNPIRDLDLVAAPFPVGERRKVLANRGLAGIDGVVSSAVGAALVRGPGLAYVGDLTFLHGSNGLMIGPAEVRPDLTIVVANDDGGGIFAGLEQGAPEFADSFERVFGTPTAARLDDLCAAYSVPHTRCKASGLADALAAPPSGLRVIEVPVERHDRRELAARLDDLARDALRPR
jgi:2-succinyl-5-enolpyruvyl-6-hydroxy-3-cyclohexene-1-carboxylate synthase